MEDNEENVCRTMRLLHIIPSLEIGGAQRLLSDLLPLQQKQADVTLLVFRHADTPFVQKIAAAGVKIICLDAGNVYDPLLVFRLRKYMKGYDVIHVHLFPALYWAAFAARGLDAKLIFTEHSTSNSRRGKRWMLPVERFVYGRYSHVVSISPQTREALDGWLGREVSRHVIYNGIDVRAFAEAAEGVVPSDSIVMVSRFAPSKDHETLIRAMQHVRHDVKLRLVGDGPLLEKAAELAGALGLSHRIEFCGAASDVAVHMAGAKVGVQSSHWEGFGLTAVEMMACGRPVLASDVPGLKQVVEGAGLLFPAGDSRELARLIDTLLGDSGLYAQTALRCSARAKEYDIAATAAGYWRIYNE